jgi:hypothetical protein
MLNRPRFCSLAASAEEEWEYAVGVDWTKHFPLDEARTFKGIFANQNVVYRDPT